MLFPYLFSSNLITWVALTKLTITLDARNCSFIRLSSHKGPKMNLSALAENTQTFQWRIVFSMLFCAVLLLITYYSVDQRDVSEPAALWPVFYPEWKAFAVSSLSAVAPGPSRGSEEVVKLQNLISSKQNTNCSVNLKFNTVT